MAVNGKSKGSGFEREIARFLTRWMSGQDKDLYCWRSPGSGSVGTINIGSKALSGDLIPLKPEAAKLFDMFSIEAKTGYPGADPLKVIKKVKNDELKAFWVQANRDAERTEKYPMLIFKKKGMKPMIGLTIDGILHFKGSNHLDLVSISINFREGLPGLVLFDMEDFFAGASYDNLS